MPIISSMFFPVVLVLETITAWQRKNHILAESKLGKLDNLILIYILSMYFDRFVLFKSRWSQQTGIQELSHGHMDILCIEKEENRRPFKKDKMSRFTIFCQCVSVNAYRRIALSIDRFSNEIVGVALYVLNFFFIQTAVTPLWMLYSIVLLQLLFSTLTRHTVPSSDSRGIRGVLVRER
jgi:hypothetical protein